MSLKIEHLKENQRTVLKLIGTVNSESAPKLFEDFSHILKQKEPLEVDLSEVEYIDSTGVATFAEIWNSFRDQGLRFSIFGLSDKLKAAFSMFQVDPEQLRTLPSPPTGFLENLGQQTIDSFQEFYQLLILMAETFFEAVIAPFKGRKIRWSSVVEQSIVIGSEALPIVGLISLLVGLTMALMSAYQLKQFGANIFIANLVGVSMTRELGPLMTAIIVAGRSGSSIAAEISTMTVTEEVDALKTMGIRPLSYLVIPKVYAITIAQPLLTVLADFLGILGGFLVAIIYLDLSAVAFIQQLLQSMVLKDIWTGLVKSVVFAWMIVVVACYKGFIVKGGAEGVGRVTTSSVVTSIFLVIVADCFFSVLFYFLME